tara:strand:- start:228 stop:518 length:291 start_codon:yes stop_codon:yes gene_type:complete
MRTSITENRMPNTKLREIIRKLRGEATLFRVSHGTYFSLRIDTCLDYECTVFSTHLNGYDYDGVGQDEIMDRDTMNEISSLLKRSTKWTFCTSGDN